MARRKGAKRRAISYLALIAVILALRSLGPILVTSFTWTGLPLKLIDSLLTFVTALSFSNLIATKIPDYHVRKIVDYILFGGAVILSVAIFFELLVSVGLTFGLIGFALTMIFQNPILSFAGWVYINVSNLYRVNDRIRIGEIKGDVIDIDIFRTKLLEIGGEHNTSNIPSGRLAYFPNSMVLTTPLYNYNKYFRYIWVEVPFTLAYGSDIKTASEIIEKELKAYLKKDVKKIRNSFKIAMGRLHVETEFEPYFININPANTGLDIRVNFVVSPLEISDATTEVARRIVEKLKKSKKVKFTRRSS